MMLHLACRTPIFLQDLLNFNRISILGMANDHKQLKFIFLIYYINIFQDMTVVKTNQTFNFLRQNDRLLVPCTSKFILQNASL